MAMKCSTCACWPRPVKGGAGPGISSLLKIKGSIIRQEINGS
jgi:hypothetical protein